MRLSKWLFISLIFHLALLIAFQVSELGVSRPVPVVQKELTEVDLVDTLPLVRQEKKDQFQRVPKKATVYSNQNRSVGKETVVRKRELDLGITKRSFGDIASNEKPGQGSEVSKDELKDIESGSENILNSKEVLYFSFYERTKGQLEQYWRPRIREKVYEMLTKRNPQLATSKVTKLLIYLDSKGTLVNVQVLKNSGLVDLDDVAIQAFKSAEPFPNPPKALIESDGLVKIRWDFIVER